MLVLTRKQGEAIYVGAEIVIRLVRVKGGQVRVGIEAPKNVTILREEIGDGPRDAGNVDLHAGDRD